MHWTRAAHDLVRDLEAQRRRVLGLVPLPGEQLDSPHTIPPDLYEALRHVVHDVGGQPDSPGLAHLDRTPTPRDTSMQATCDCLSRRGALDAFERRQAEDELGETIYAASPVHARTTIVAAHLLMDKGVITPDGLQAKMAEVRARLERV